MYAQQLTCTCIYIYILEKARAFHARSKLDMSTEALKDSLNSLVACNFAEQKKFDMSAEVLEDSWNALVAVQLC